MKIEGNILKVKDEWVYIRQFWSGYIYKSPKRCVKVRMIGDKPEKVNGKPVGVINGIGCSNNVIAIRLSANYIN